MPVRNPYHIKSGPNGGQFTTGSGQAPEFDDGVEFEKSQRRIVAAAREGARLPFTKKQIHEWLGRAVAGERLTVQDPGIGETTLLIKKVVIDPDYRGGKQIGFALVNYKSPTQFDYYEQSIDSLEEYLLEAKARRHFGDGA